ncbi:hypothetical protein JTE90_018589 [Oedothorax gibbosus]|uniref:BTB domain-containing protein n=1 Tax=Oedothorax gibbosus TaxID=931172 RepID=A0AAV6TLF0_9ARAC|nr:hypothetical protein JTE90_018589 [Oedothorax gibbosus]
MSCADEEGCFTFTWEIENVDIFLCADYGELSSPAWKTETTEGKAVEWQVLADHRNESIRFRLIGLNELCNPARYGCFSFVYYNFVCDCIMAEQTRNCEDIEYNDLRTECKVKWLISKQSVTRNASCQFNFELGTIVAHHSNSQYQITHPTSSAIAKIGGSSESVAENGPSLRSLRIDLLELYRDGILSDATINTDGKSFSAHRSIMAARSPVFRAMFEKDEMSEGRSGVVDIDDVDSETVDRMLVFLYGDSLQGLQWGEAASLYYAADKYAVQPLKQMCADILKGGLTVDNVCDALVLADTHSDEQLMKNVADFIYDHQEVVSSPKFEQLEDINLRLTSKVTKELFLKRGKK